MSRERLAMQSQPDEQALEAAERWLARLAAPDCSAADREAFERWRASPEHAEAFLATEHLWRSLGQLAGRPDAVQLSARVLAETAPCDHRVTVARPVLAAAASLAIALIGTAVYVGMSPSAPTKTYSTETGQRSVVRLEDGSQLTLNAATRIDVTLRRDERHFTLHSGEVLFDVAEDRSRPFTVSAGDGEVTALATRFTVRKDPDRTIVTLLEGRVAVDRPDQRQVQLNAGEQLRLDVAARKVQRRTIDPEVAASWTTGRLKFRSTPLTEVVDEVNRYSKIPIRMDDASLAATPVSGTFELGDQDSMVAALQALLPIDVAMQDRGEIVLTRR